MEEVIVKRYPNGNVYEEYIMKDGKKQGQYKSFYPNGDLQVISHYVNGLLDGEFRGYDSQGVLISAEIYSKDEMISSNL